MQNIWKIQYNMIFVPTNNIEYIYIYSNSFDRWCMRVLKKNITKKLLNPQIQMSTLFSYFFSHIEFRCWHMRSNGDKGSFWSRRDNRIHNDSSNRTNNMATAKNKVTIH